MSQHFYVNDARIVGTTTGGYDIDIPLDPHIEFETEIIEGQVRGNAWANVRDPDQLEVKAIRVAPRQNSDRMYTITVPVTEPDWCGCDLHAL